MPNELAPVDLWSWWVVVISAIAAVVGVVSFIAFWGLILVKGKRPGEKGFWES